ncbi:hypothetical protein ACET5C_31715, partial [Pseudomonas aeruginosa]
KCAPLGYIAQSVRAQHSYSLRAVHLLATLRQRLSRRVPLQAFAGGPATPEALLELLRQAAPEATSRSRAPAPPG